MPIIVRPLREEDKSLLEDCISRDDWHKETTAVEFFFDKRAISTVYQFDGESSAPIMFVKGSPVLRLDIQFCFNDDKQGNAMALQKLSEVVETARTSGYTEIVFNTESPLLKAYCMKHFDFIELNGELRRYL